MKMLLCCVDYRKIKIENKQDSYAIPRMDKRIDWLGKATSFSMLDICIGNWQIAFDVAEEDKTLFISHLGLYCIVRLPIELCNGPWTLQCTMEVISSGIN